MYLFICPGCLHSVKVLIKVPDPQKWPSNVPGAPLDAGPSSHLPPATITASMGQHFTSEDIKALCSSLITLEKEVFILGCTQ